MPFYFILALPFYLIGELGFLSLLGILVFYGLIKYMKVASPYPVLFILLITTSPFYLWEVLVRSNIFLNAILIACSIVLFFRIKNYASLKNQLFIGGIIGLLLSTRNVFALCYIIFFLHTIRTGQLSLQSAIKIGGISILVLSLHFYLLWWDSGMIFCRWIHSSFNPLSWCRSDGSWLQLFVPVLCFCFASKMRMFFFTAEWSCL